MNEQSAKCKAQIGQRDARGNVHGTRSSAFTLLEVMIASGILFMCLFAILALVSNSLRNARILQRQKVEVGSVASWLYTQLVTTNRMPEGSQTLDLADLDKSFRDYQCDWQCEQVMTNGLYQIDIVLHRRSGDISQLSFYLFNPIAQQNTFGGGLRR
jgi:Tfp pilus assembly protein PilV